MSTPDALIERLRARTAGPKCNADGTYTVGNCSPDVLMFEAAAEIERLRGIVPEVLERLNDELCAENERLRADAARYRWLRATTNWVSSKGERINVRDNPELWDSAIDAAMRDATNV